MIFTVIASRSNGKIRYHVSNVGKSLFDKHPLLYPALVTSDPIIGCLEIEASSKDNALILGKDRLGFEVAPTREVPRYSFQPRLYHGGPVSKSPRHSITLKLRALSDANKVWGRSGFKPADSWAARNISGGKKKRK